MEEMGRWGGCFDGKEGGGGWVEQLGRVGGWGWGGGGLVGWVVGWLLGWVGR